MDKDGYNPVPNKGKSDILDANKKQKSSRAPHSGSASSNSILLPLSKVAKPIAQPLPPVSFEVPKTKLKVAPSKVSAEVAFGGAPGAGPTPLFKAPQVPSKGLPFKQSLPATAIEQTPSLNPALSKPSITFYRTHLTSQALNELAKPIDKKLIARMKKKGWKIVIAQEGSDDFRYLTHNGADASINSHVAKHIVIKEGAHKSALLEEYLHGVQLKLGLLEKYGTTQALEVHVKDFMLKHVKMLGLDNQHDIKLLQQLKIEEIQRLNDMGLKYEKF